MVKLFILLVLHHNLKYVNLMYPLMVLTGMNYMVLVGSGIYKLLSLQLQEIAMGWR